jgi:hypothetical protein
MKKKKIIFLPAPKTFGLRLACPASDAFVGGGIGVHSRNSRLPLPAAKLTQDPATYRPIPAKK